MQCRCNVDGVAENSLPHSLFRLSLDSISRRIEEMLDIKIESLHARINFLLPFCQSSEYTRKSTRVVQLAAQFRVWCRVLIRRGSSS